MGHQNRTGNTEKKKARWFKRWSNLKIANLVDTRTKVGDKRLSQRNCGGATQARWKTNIGRVPAPLSHPSSSPQVLSSRTTKSKNGSSYIDIQNGNDSVFLTQQPVRLAPSAKPCYSTSLPTHTHYLPYFLTSPLMSSSFSV